MLPMPESASEVDIASLAAPSSKANSSFSAETELPLLDSPPSPPAGESALHEFESSAFSVAEVAEMTATAIFSCRRCKHVSIKFCRARRVACDI